MTRQEDNFISSHEPSEEEEEVVFTRGNRGGLAQHGDLAADMGI